MRGTPRALSSGYEVARKSSSGWSGDSSVTESSCRWPSRSSGEAQSVGSAFSSTLGLGMGFGVGVWVGVETGVRAEVRFGARARVRVGVGVGVRVGVRVRVRVWCSSTIAPIECASNCTFATPAACSACSQPPRELGY